MFNYELRELRRSLDEGDPVAPDAVRRALDLLDQLRSQIGTPTELHLSALASADHPGRWTVTHPLLRIDASSSNAADAVILAAAELRQHFPGSIEDGQEPKWREDRVNHAEWEALARGDTREAGALRGALDHIESVEAELAEERDRKWERRIVGGGGSRAERERTIARMRARSLERLSECNVEGTDHAWSTDGFGSLENFGIPAPVLVLAAHASTERSAHVDYRFTADRRWIALSHRCSDGIGSENLNVVATPLQTDMDTHHRLGRLTQIAAGRNDTVGHLQDYQSAVDELFGPVVTVNGQRGAIGGGCWPFDLDSLAALTDLSRDEIDTWAEPDGSRWFRLGPSWQLLLLTPAAEL